ncbi:MAG: hypothetical protein FD143_3705, partial [Ignavibacteria bacterium]
PPHLSFCRFLRGSMGRTQTSYDFPQTFDSFGDRSIKSIKNLIFGYYRPKVAFRPTIFRPSVHAYIIGDSNAGPWLAPSVITGYPKHSIVLEIGRYQMLKI